MANVKISELPVATGPIEDDDILLLVRDSVTYQISGSDHEAQGVTSFNGRLGNVTLNTTDVTDALGYFPIQRNSTPNFVYANNVSGTPGNVIYSQGGVMNSSIVQRTATGQIDSITLPDSNPQAGDTNLVNRAYVNELRSDRISSVNSSVGSVAIAADRDGIIVTGLDVASLSITLPSAITKYKRVLVKFRANITALTINPGNNVSVLPNTIDYSPTSANAGDLFEWGYDVTTSTWLVTNYVSFNSLP